jgi:hypothetical protein
MTFTVTSSDEEIATVFASSNKLLVQPLSVGDASFDFIVTDAEGASLTKSIEVKVNVILGIDENGSQGVSVYPNPVEKFAHISLTEEWTGEVEFQVIDLSGRQHLMQKADMRASREITINVSKLTKGFYILKAVSNEKNTTVKLIKE